MNERMNAKWQLTRQKKKKKKPKWVCRSLDPPSGFPPCRAGEGELLLGIQVAPRGLARTGRGFGQGTGERQKLREGARPCLRVISRSPALRCKQKLAGVPSAPSQAGIGSRVINSSLWRPRALRGLGISRDGSRRWPPAATAGECLRSAVTRRASAASGGAGPGLEASGNPGPSAAEP